MIRNLNIFNLIFLHVSECVSFNFMIRILFFFSHPLKKVATVLWDFNLGLRFIYLFSSLLSSPSTESLLQCKAIFFLFLIKLPDIQKKIIKLYSKYYYSSFTIFFVCCVCICECIYICLWCWCVLYFITWYSEYCQNKKFHRLHRCKKSKI